MVISHFLKVLGITITSPLKRKFRPRNWQESERKMKRKHIGQYNHNVEEIRIWRASWWSLRFYDGSTEVDRIKVRVFRFIQISGSSTLQVWSFHLEYLISSRVNKIHESCPARQSFCSSFWDDVSLFIIQSCFHSQFISVRPRWIGK